MIVHRICRRAYAALDGEGARLYGGRWNTPGTPLVYASATLSLAALEYLVHLDPGEAPPDLVALAIELPDEAPVALVAPVELPRDWARVPAHPDCQAIGDAWARRGETLALRVPSAVVPEEENLLLNPRHPDMSRVRMLAERPFSFDPRLRE